MNREEIINFFDRCADSWDEEMIKDDGIIKAILDGAQVERGKSVLDVACGTGVLIPYCLEREVRSVTGVDISPRMVQIAVEKFKNPAVKIKAADIMEFETQELFDCIVIYNAFPHFMFPAKLIKKLKLMLAPGGTLATRYPNQIWFWRHLFANISLKMLGIHKVFLRFSPHLGKKSACQNCKAP